MDTNQQLSAGAGTGAQASTQNPQTSSPSNNLATDTENTQTSSPDSVLNGQGSIQLHPTVVPSVNLASVTTVGTTQPSTQTTHHTTNPALLGVSCLLFVVAIVLFWTTYRGDKNTTEKT
jgi:hypothetical protein